MLLLWTLLLREMEYLGQPIKIIIKKILTVCLYVVIMSHTSLELWARNSFLKAGTTSEVWSVWLNGWVFSYELSGCGFESRCCQNFSSNSLFIFLIFLFLFFLSLVWELTCEIKNSKLFISWSNLSYLIIFNKVTNF